MTLQEMLDQIGQVLTESGNLNCQELQKLWDELDKAKSGVQEQAELKSCDWASGPMPSIF